MSYAMPKGIKHLLDKIDVQRPFANNLRRFLFENNKYSARVSAGEVEEELGQAHQNPARTNMFK
jgi:hypothetical protein